MEAVRRGRMSVERIVVEILNLKLHFLKMMVSQYERVSTVDRKAKICYSRSMNTKAACRIER